MPLTPEQQEELSRFPAALRALVEHELAAGNAVLEVGHSFPAPPVGAYVLLARQVTTRPRLTGSGLDFRARHSSSHSGEFTDAARTFFVLEAPDPPPPEPDMDAIRRAANPPSSDLEERALHRAPRSPAVPAVAPSSSPTPLSTAPDSTTTTDLPAGALRVLHVRDRRPPEEMRAHLERELTTVFASAVDQGRLTMLAHAWVNGARYVFELRFLAAHLLHHAYSLRIEASWAEHEATHHAYFRRTFDSWVALGTRDLPVSAPSEEATDTARYQRACARAQEAEQELHSIEAIQKAILEGLARGASFSTAHKEGGSRIVRDKHRWVRTDYGDYPDRIEYASPEKFLAALRQFFQGEVSRHTPPGRLKELDAWRLIFRQLRHD